MCTSHANFELNTHVINYTISVSIVAQVQPHTAANMAVDWEWQ